MKDALEKVTSAASAHQVEAQEAQMLAAAIQQAQEMQHGELERLQRLNETLSKESQRLAQDLEAMKAEHDAVPKYEQLGNNVDCSQSNLCLLGFVFIHLYVS